MLIDFFKKIFGLDKLDYRIRRLERAKYWKEKYEKAKMKIKKVMKGLQKASKTHAAQAKTLKGVLHGGSKSRNGKKA